MKHKMKQPLKIGARVVALEKKMSAKLAGGSKGDVEKFEVILIGSRACGQARCAVFSVEMKSKEPAFTMTIAAKGEMLIEIDTLRLVKAELKGPMTMRGEKDGLTMDGKGTMSIIFSQEYSRGGP